MDGTKTKNTPLKRKLLSCTTARSSTLMAVANPSDTGLVQGRGREGGKEQESEGRGRREGEREELPPREREGERDKERE